MRFTTGVGRDAVRAGGDGGDPGERFRQHLLRHGLKQTSQRARILEVFLDMGGHPTMEDVYGELARRGWNVGMATVYRTMRLLLDAGVAHKQRFGDGVERYEVKVGRRQHVHFICEVCGRSMDIVAPGVERNYAQLARANGFILGTHQTYLHGVCPECSRLFEASGDEVGGPGNKKDTRI